MLMALSNKIGGSKTIRNIWENPAFKSWSNNSVPAESKMSPANKPMEVVIVD